MTLRIPSACALFLLSLIAGSPSLADPDLITTQRGDASEQSTRPGMSPSQLSLRTSPSASAKPVKDLPLEALAAARGLSVALNIRPGLEKALATAGNLDEQKFQTSIQRLPAQAQARLLVAYDTAFDETSRYRVDEQLDNWARYFASHMNVGELQQLTAFYGSPIGSKMVHDPQSVTPDEKKEAGRMMLAHPEMMKLMQVNSTYLKEAMDGAAAKRAEFQRDLNSRLCANIDKAGVKDVSCSNHNNRGGG